MNPLFLLALAGVGFFAFKDKLKPARLVTGKSGTQWEVRSLKNDGTFGFFSVTAKGGKEPTLVYKTKPGDSTKLFVKGSSTSQLLLTKAISDFGIQAPPKLTTTLTKKMPPLPKKQPIAVRK